MANDSSFPAPVLEAEDDPRMEQLAEQASALEEAVRAEAEQGGWGQYTHLFKTPFSYEGRTFPALTFDWTKLTGADSLAIEMDILTRTGRAIVAPKFSGEYLAGMAVRACVSLSQEGKPMDLRILRALPLGVFQKICGSARNFLILSEL